MKKYLFVIVSLIIVVAGFGALFAFAPQAQEPDQRAAIPQDQIPEGTDPSQIPENVVARNTCVEHGGISMHIHPMLSVIVNGEAVAIPSNIGIADDCMRALHTHDETGKIHIEFPTEYQFTLGDFFANWGQTFNENEIMGHIADEEHDIVLTVDGVVSDAYQGLILTDEQQIVIEYLEIAQK